MISIDFCALFRIASKIIVYFENHILCTFMHFEDSFKDSCALLRIIFYSFLCTLRIASKILVHF